jgi:serine/threonine-protein kinase HipA
MNRTLLVTMDWPGQRGRVGELSVFEEGGREHYQFVYSKEWPRHFPIDPSLPVISGLPYHSSDLWGAFQDISPDRWGRLLQDRAHKGHLSAADYMLGVSDYMRLGALRLSDAKEPDIFLAKENQVPPLTSLRELEAASLRIEKGIETDDDIRLLLDPGSSVGGANPKAVVENNDLLYIAKFQSRFSTARTSSWEATLFDMAKSAGLTVAKHRLLNAKSERPVLLVERFDRVESGRVPFSSAMTLMQLRDASEGGSYAELAGVVQKVSSQPKVDLFELWQRMTFNAMTGNTDDHLRNHGFLRDQQGWRLAPAYDLNPNPLQYKRRRHALSFDGESSSPSLDLCKDLAPYFDVDEQLINHSLKNIGLALKSWKGAAKKNQLEAEEIKRFEPAFVHDDSEKLIALVGKNRKSLTL